LLAPTGAVVQAVPLGALTAPAEATVASRATDAAGRLKSWRKLQRSAETRAPLLALSATKAAAPHQSARELTPRCAARGFISSAIGGIDGGCCGSRTALIDVGSVLNG
jgi:hypothetical protein